MELDFAICKVVLMVDCIFKCEILIQNIFELLHLLAPQSRAHCRLEFRDAIHPSIHPIQSNIGFKTTLYGYLKQTVAD